MRFIKYIIYTVITLAVLAVFAVGLVVLFIDPNDYRDKIEQIAHDRAGVALTIEGDLAWTFYPWLGISLGKSSIAPITDPDNPLAAINQVDLSLKLLPIFSGEVEMSHIRIDGLKLNLHRNQEGIENWAFLLGNSEVEEGEEIIEKSDRNRNMHISGISMINSAFDFKDEQNGVELALNNLSFNSGNIEQRGDHYYIENIGIDSGNLEYKDAQNRRDFNYHDINVSLDKAIWIGKEGQFNLELGNFRIGEGIVAFYDYQEGKAFASDKINLNLQGLTWASTQDLFVKGLSTEGMKITFSDRESGENITFVPQSFSLDEVIWHGQPQGDEVAWQITRFNLENSTLFYRSHADEPYLTVNQLSLNSNKIGGSDAGTIEMRAEIDNGKGITANLHGKTALNYDLTNALYQLNGLTIDSIIRGKTIPNEKMEFSAGGAITIDQKKEDITWRDPNIRLNGLLLKHDIHLQGFSADRLNVTTMIDLKNFNLRSFLTTIGVTLPTMQKQDALTSLTLTSNMNLSAHHIELRDIDLTLDQSHFSGAIKVNDFMTPVIDLRLSGNQLNIDQYLPVNMAKNSGNSNKPDSSSSLFPRKISLTANVAMKEIKYDAYQVSNLNVGLRLKDGVLNIQRGDGTLYQGSLSLTGQIDGRTNMPIISLKPTLNGLSLSPFIAAMKLNIPLAGHLNLSGDLTTRGSDLTSLMGNLSGNARANIADGVLEGINYEREICQGLAMLNRESLTGQFNQTSTYFNALSASLRIDNGLVRNNDLAISIPGIQAHGDGVINLKNETLDYRLGVQVSRQLNADPACRVNQYIADNPIPLRCNGSFTAGGKGLCSLDSDAVAKMVANIAGQAVKKKAEEALKKELDRTFEKEFGDHADDIKGLLKGLF